MLYLRSRFKKEILHLGELFNKKAEDSQMELKIEFNFYSLCEHPLLKERYLHLEKTREELSTDVYWNRKNIHFLFSNGIIFLINNIDKKLSFYPLEYLKLEGEVFGKFLGEESHNEPSLVTHHNESNGHVVLYFREQGLGGKVHILCDFPMREIIQLSTSDDTEKYNKMLEKNNIQIKTSDGDVYKDELGEWQSIDFNHGYTIYETKYFKFHYKKLTNFKF